METCATNGTETTVKIRCVDEDGTKTIALQACETRAKCREWVGFFLTRSNRKEVAMMLAA